MDIPVTGLLCTILKSYWQKNFETKFKHFYNFFALLHSFSNAGKLRQIFLFPKGSSEE